MQNNKLSNIIRKKKPIKPIASKSCEFKMLTEQIDTEQQCMSDTYEFEIDDLQQRKLFQIQLTLGDVKKLIKAKKETLNQIWRQITTLKSNILKLQNDISYFEIKVYSSLRQVKQM
ncbi:Hypothetical_protein [Hexamita inflata]|uniref:Hypothetical_protein n=1 Tax=Hexamita inflata TaxID=28002 RepID=A0AA86QPV1_9EUKA|nr:Hypothetical protein HINF_LOCUS51274 [Hexamita inflata]